MPVPNHGESDTLFLMPPNTISKAKTSQNHSQQHHHQQQQQQQHDDGETQLFIPGTRFLLGPRKCKILRANPAPFSEMSPLLTTRLDTRSHPILLRETHVSMEQLSPHPDCRSRRSTLVIALFNLVATVCGGGGVLTLPLVFARAGIIPTTILMIFGATATDASLQRLVDAARSTGGRSYGDVSQAAFGKIAQVITTATLATMLVGSLIAYLLLTRDVWAPVIFTLLPSLQQGFLWILHLRGTSTTPPTMATTNVYDVVFPLDLVDPRAANLLLLTILLLAIPLMLKRELYSLRFTCYIGFGSCITLAIAVFVRASERLYRNGFFHELHHLNWWSYDPTDWLFAFPMVALCFFCSYNVLSVHSQLHNPTRERISWVLRSSMMICFVLFYIVGLGGYIYAHPYTPENIITAFPMNDMYVLAGRMGYCLTLLFGLPLILLPCREAWVSFPEQIRDWRHDQELIAKYNAINENADQYFVNGIDFDEPNSFSPRNRYSHIKPSYVESSTTSSEDGEEGYQSLRTKRSGLAETSAWTQRSLHSVLEEEDEEEVFPSLTKQPAAGALEDGLVQPNELEKKCGCTEDVMRHWISTVVLMTVTYTTAISVPGVATVWSIFGSSMALFIAFVVPMACFIQIRRKDGVTGKALFAWSLLIVSLAAMVVCTNNAVICALQGTL